MKKTIAILFAVLLALPTTTLADSYEKLWKQVETAGQKDLPKTQIELLQKIADKAEKEGNYGQLLEAKVRMVSAKTIVSPDSLAPALAQIEAEAALKEKADPATASVYYAVLGAAYRDMGRAYADSKSKSEAFFAKAMSDPKLLASKTALAYKPFVMQGNDSKVFNNDLLSLIGYEAKAYKLMHDYYVTTSNRAATLLTALEMVKKNGEENGAVWGTKEHGSKYAASLDSLINLYSDLTECGEAAIERYNFMARCTDVKGETKVAYLKKALAKWGTWHRMNVLRNALKELQNPSVAAYMNQNTIAPGSYATMKITANNVDAVNVKVSKLSVDGSTKLNPRNYNEFKELRGKIIPNTTTTQTRNYPGKADYKSNEDSVAVGGLPVGVYMVEVSTSNYRVTPKRSLLYVTDMYIVHQALPHDSLRVAVVSATTGQPVKGATLAMTNGDTKTSTVKCGDNGEAVLYDGRQGIDFLRAFTDSDKAFPFVSAYNNFYYYNNVNTNTVVNMFTDRKIYRPDQTVHASLTAHTVRGIEAKVVSGRTFALKMYDANRQVVSEKSVTTDDFGTASADFALPSGGLTGGFTIVADNQWSGSVAFLVEEYKRPTFMVEMPDVKEKYQNGDTLTVVAHAKSYAGMPVQGASVKYKVRRETALWWRFYPSSNSDTTPNGVLFEGTATTDADGSFKMKMPMVLPSWAGNDSGISLYDFNRISRFYNIVAEADVTDQSGETRSGELILPLSNKSTAFGLDLSEKIVRDSLKTIKFTLKNAAGNDIEGDVRYYIDGSQTAFTAKANHITKIDWNTHDRLKSGKHTLLAVCGNYTIRQNFIVFGMDDKKPCIETHDWFYVSGTKFKADGSPVYLQIGSSDADTHILYTAISGSKVIARGTVDISNEVLTRALTYKEKYGSGLLLNFAWVKDGKLYNHRVTLERPMPDRSLNLKWTTFRDKLTPGQGEEWTLSITKPDGTPAKAQLMATLYDGSLDQIAPLEWNLSISDWLNQPSSFWKGCDFSSIRLHSDALWKRLDEAGLGFNFMNLISYYSPNKYLFGRGRDGQRIMLTRHSALASGTVLQAKEELLQSNTLSKVSPRAVVDVADVRGGALAEDRVYENSDEVFVTGSVEGAGEKGKGNAQVQLRENLNETAFFYPALVSDDNGNVTLRFTLPESITTWHFMGLAHDKDMNNGMLEGKSVASKTVMIQPNMPRFVRVGDRTAIAAKVINTSDKKVKGTAEMILIDPETEREVYSQKRQFVVEAGQTGSVSFDYYPSDEYSLLICKMIASGKKFSDGEQHYLPVLSDKEMVTTMVPFTQNAAGTKTIDIGLLFPDKAKDKKLTLEYTNNPAWLMVQALPYVGTVRSNDAIGLATALYANSVSSYLVGNTPKINSVFEQWKREANGNSASLASNLEKNQELKDLVLDETPWVMDARNEAEQKRSVANFFDKAAMQNRLSAIVGDLKKLQNADGSWPWWPGMRGSEYITSSVSELLARLSKMTGTPDREIAGMLDKAMDYLGACMMKEVEDMKKAEKEGRPYMVNGDLALEYLYTNALHGRKMPSMENAAAEYLLTYLKKQNTASTLYTKSLMAVVLAQRGETSLAKNYIKSLEEYTVFKEESGRYYDSPRATYSWRDYRIPTQAAAIEAMALVDGKAYAKEIDEMKRWLLYEKRTQAWDTPLNSANAVYAFLNGNQMVLENQPEATFALDGTFMELPKTTAGLGYVKTSVDVKKAGNLTITKTSKGTSWGAVYSTSLQDLADISASSSGFSVTREIVAPDGTARISLKVGDKVKVRITITADRDYDFVQVKDKRAACFEPATQLSGYANGYYCTPKDYSTNYYFDRMRKGTHVIETEYYVDRNGRYETGTCSVQCAYSPEYTARTASAVIEVK